MFVRRRPRCSTCDASGRGAMKRPARFLAAAPAFVAAAAQAQSNCQYIGNQRICSDAQGDSSTTQRIGNQDFTNYSNGQSANNQRMGNQSSRLSAMGKPRFRNRSAISASPTSAVVVAQQPSRSEIKLPRHLATVIPLPVRTSGINSFVIEAEVLRVNMQHFNVVIEGNVLRGKDASTVAPELAKLIKRDITFATLLLQGHPTTIKSNVDDATGERYTAALERIGVAARLEAETLEIDPIVIKPEQVAPTPRPASNATVDNEEGAPSILSQEDFYRAAVGPQGEDFYLDYFARADSAGKMLPSWNWPAFLFGGFWTLYRKMYLWFFVFWGVIILSRIFERGGAVWPSIIVSAGASIGFAVYANALYHKRVLQRIAAATTTNRDQSRVLARLRSQGGVSGLLPSVLIGLPVIGIIAAIAIPAYRGHTMRAEQPPDSFPSATPSDRSLAQTPRGAAQHNKPTVPAPLEDGTYIYVTRGGERSVTAQSRAWSGSLFDQFDSVDEIERKARGHYPLLKDSRAWAAVLEWQQVYISINEWAPNSALYDAVYAVAQDLRENNRICRPGVVTTVTPSIDPDGLLPPGGKIISLNCS